MTGRPEKMLTRATSLSRPSLPKCSVIVAFLIQLSILSGCGGGKKSSSAPEDSEPSVTGTVVAGEQPDSDSGSVGGVGPISPIPQNTPVVNVSPTIPDTSNTSPAPGTTPAAKRRIYYQTGFLAQSFNDATQVENGFQGWVTTVSNSQVVNVAKLTTDFVSKDIDNE